MKPVVVLSGPVGAGKTSVAWELIALSPGPVAYIEGDLFWSFFVKGGEEKTRLESFRTIMRSMTAASVPFALADNEVILDFTIPPWYLPTVKKVLDFRNVPLDYVVFRPSEAVCAARAAARPEGKIADYSPYRELYAEFDKVEKHWVGDDTSSAAEVAAQIRAGLDAGRFRV